MIERLVQVSAMCKGLHYHLSNIARIRPYISKEACEHACRAVALSRLDYVNSVLYGANNSQIQRLQCVQNRAAKLIFKALAPTSPLAPSQKTHTVNKILTITYKCLHKHAPTKEL